MLLKIELSLNFQLLASSKKPSLLKAVLREVLRAVLREVLSLDLRDDFNIVIIIIFFGLD